MTARLSHVEVEGGGDRAPPPEIEQERAVAIFDLLEDNRFALVGGPDGPYRLKLGIESGKLRFGLVPEGGGDPAVFALQVGSLRQVVKDYGQICRSYYEAVRMQVPSETEALDEARRAIHHEGGRVMQERLAGRAELDEATARRLFTLVCALMPSE